MLIVYRIGINLCVFYYFYCDYITIVKHFYVPMQIANISHFDRVACRPHNIINNNKYHITQTMGA